MQMTARVGLHHYGPELHEAAEGKAERIVREELERLGWTEDELRTRRKGDPAKLAITRRLRRETTMTLQWVVERLCMGSKTYLAHLLYWEQHKKGEQPRGYRSKVGRSPTHRSNAARTHLPSPPVADELTLLGTDPESRFDTSFD